MKAAFFYGGEDIRLADVPDPVPGPGEALVRVKAAGICGSDLHGYRDPRRIWPGLGIPYMTGHELAGEIAALGPDVSDLIVGQRVCVEPRHLVGCGRCRWCRRGDYHLCPDLGTEKGKKVYSTGFAEYSLEPANKLYPLPDHVPEAEATLLDVYSCAVHALHLARINISQTIVVVGAGPIGLTALEIFKISGVAQVIVCDINDHSLETASRLGADHVINSHGADSVEAVRDMTHGNGADLVIEAVGGTAPTFSSDIKMAGRGGTVLVMGSYGGPQSINPDDVQVKEICVRWSWSYALWEGVSEYQICLNLLATGKLKAKEYITHTFPLDKILEAFATADNKKQSNAMKVIIQPQAAT
jgi:threonine dehydrogenase-like Zn-dependent dehydrogenase